MKQDDKLLQQAATLAYEELVAETEFPGEEIKFSKRHEEKMKEIFAKTEQRTDTVRVSGLVKLAACIATIAVLICAITLLGVGWKRRCINYHFDPNKPATSVNISDGSPSTYSKKFIFIGYVPGGFVETQTRSDETIESVRLEKDGLWIEYSAYMDKEFDIDENIKINGFEGMLVEENNASCLFWNDDKFGFVVSTNLPENELIKIAESAECYR